METLEVPPPSLSQLRLRASRFVSRDPEVPSDLGSAIRGGEGWGGGGGGSVGSRRIGLKMCRASEAPKSERPTNWCI